MSDEELDRLADNAAVQAEIIRDLLKLDNGAARARIHALKLVHHATALYLALHDRTAA